MPKPRSQAESLLAHMLVPEATSSVRLWTLGLLLVTWIGFLLALYFLTVAGRQPVQPQPPASFPRNAATHLTLPLA